MSNEIPTGARLENPASVMARLGRKKTWLWDQVRHNKEFPRPVPMGTRNPMFLVHEIDAYVAKLAAKREGGDHASMA